MVKARLIAVMLREEYIVERVILFGSLAEGSIRGGSDIDLAVTGADMERYIDMYWDASELARPFPLDLVPLETASPALRNNIQGSGVEL
jgi:predicted nucleotidyltransferase